MLGFSSTVNATLAIHLKPEDLRRIETILEQRRSIQRLPLEVEYQSLVHPETMEALSQVYAPENQQKLQITYGSFTPEGKRRGEDMGYGLHVIKRLDHNGRRVEVNEHWPEDRVSGGLFLPDEIRVKIQVYEGPRRLPESHRLYLFDSLRIAWDEDEQVAMVRRNPLSIEPVRVPVSSPFSCLQCHDSNERFASKFLREGEVRNFESIVQDRHFEISPSQTHGFREYVRHLEKRGFPHSFRDRVMRSLANPHQSMELPNFHSHILRSRDSISWVSDDFSIEQFSYWYPPYGQGVYPWGPSVMVDVTNVIFEGKYRYWTPRVAVP